MLYIVATPIGNLEDITLRAIRTLKEADLIACEDTRKTGILIKHLEIEKKPMMSFHSYSGNTKVNKILEELKVGKKVALVSDAGTPGISDPGYNLIRDAINEGIKVSPIPGVSACITAICASGMPMNHFLYLGFLPVKKGRQTMFKKLQNKEQTAVIYESVHRIMKTLEDLKNYFGEDHYIVVGRELTKIYEEFVRGTVSEVIEYFQKKEKQKGEFVVMF
ncbi:MAG: 16S rRNA (cytidine(1402)-2'-O)-methyltransferase [Candidatus Gracilibacteria bacterium]|nr:16S rRNA (cytidine(1402)-2'-O)-methyltransferase [Candidatus Gracilibacteria bacterium]